MPSLLPRTFFQRHHLEVARDLIGTTLIWGSCGGIVVETESYAVEGDPACHTASRPSTREFVEQSPAGTAYVYLNYGMYWLVNVLVKGGAEDGIVLIRALEPITGIPLMKRRRAKKELTDLCSGPGKLSIALGINQSTHGTSLSRVGQTKKPRGFLKPEKEASVVTDTRIGISKAKEYPWRFLLEDSPFVSVPPKAQGPKRKRKKRLNPFGSSRKLLANNTDVVYFGPAVVSWTTS